MGSSCGEVWSWDGKRRVEAAWSKGKSGVMALSDFSDNLIRDDRLPWPTPAVLQKLFHSGTIEDFDDEARQVLERKLGYYKLAVHQQ
jgi:hypothetical protein